MSPRRPPPPHANVHLPSLDGHQALIFVNILDRIISAIWRAHGHAMTAVLEERRAPDSSALLEPSPSLLPAPGSEPDDFPF